MPAYPYWFQQITFPRCFERKQSYILTKTYIIWSRSLLHANWSCKHDRWHSKFTDGKLILWAKNEGPNRFPMTASNQPHFRQVKIFCRHEFISSWTWHPYVVKLSTLISGREIRNSSTRLAINITLSALNLIPSEKIHSCAFTLKSNISNLQEFFVWCIHYAPQTFNSFHATNKSSSFCLKMSLHSDQ